MKRLDAETAILILACGLAVGLCLFGINWGRYESWHPDQMALIYLLHEDLPPLHPGRFLKPPFHTYLTFAFVYVPVKLAEILFGLSPHTRWSALLIGARLLTAGLFVGIILISNRLVREFVDRQAASVVALLVATSAGMVMYSHFLTADLPVTFWMLFSFYVATKIYTQGRWRHYVFAGLLVGVATATKYNGLAVGIAIPMAHWMLCRKSGAILSDYAFSPRLILGLSAVPVGFLVANPYAVLDSKGFLSDFIFNYVTTPVFEGQTTGTSYLDILLTVPEVFGWPLSLAIAVGVFVSGRHAFKRWRAAGDSVAVFWILCASVFLLYYAKFGAYPRWEARWGLPVYPYLLFMASLGLISFPKLKRLSVAIPLVAYWVLCSVYVGYRLVSDPRMEAQIWVSKNVAPGSIVESTSFSPRWSRLPDVTITSVRMPRVSGRAKVFSRQLSNNELVLDKLNIDADERNVSWYNVDELGRRNPDYLALNSGSYDRFLSGFAAQDYPEIRAFFEQALAEQSGYRIVFDMTKEEPLKFVYPRQIQFISSRMTILRRE